MFIYRATGTNDDYLGSLTYEFGNVFQAFLGVSDQFVIFNTLFNPGLTFKYRDAGMDRINDFEVENTGGNWIFLIPNFSLNISPQLSFVNRFEIPLYSNVDGTQLTPTFRLTSGLLFTISPREQVLNSN